MARRRGTPAAPGADDLANPDPGAFTIEAWLGDVPDEPNSWQTEAERQRSRRARAFVDYLGARRRARPGITARGPADGAA